MRDSLAMMVRGRPLVPVAGLLILGIVAGRVFDFGVGIGFGVLGVAGFLLVVRRARVVGVMLGIVGVGMTLYAGRYRMASEFDSRMVLSGEPELVTVRGKLVETPSLRDFQAGSNNVVYSHAVIEAGEVQRNKKWERITGRLATVTRGELAGDFFEGRSVEITGVINLPPRAAAPGLFDYRAYLRNLRIFHQVRCDSTNDWLLLSTEGMPVTEKFRRWAQVQLQRGLPEQDERVEMIWAMTLGIKRALSGEASEPFLRTGTMHIFAVSGLHVACIAGFLLYLLQAAGMTREQAGFITIPLIWFYTLATGWQSSAIRSALMFSVIVAGRMLKRPSDLVNSTAAAAILLLLFQPEQLFQAGFQLSFAVVASIGLLMPMLERMRPEFFPPDPLLPQALWPKWRLWVNPAWRFGTVALAVSIASWIGAMPIVAYYFNIVTPNSFVANLVAVPLSTVSLAATVMSLLAWPVAPVFNYFGWVFMDYTIGFTELCAKIPWGYSYVPKPNAFFMIFYFAAVLVAAIPAFRFGRGKTGSITCVVLLGGIWLGSVLMGRAAATMTVLPCAGTPAYVEVAGEEDLLIDCSNERDADFVVKGFLRARGRGTIDTLLLTHGDIQSAGGFGLVWDEFRPEVVVTSTARARSPVYRRAMRFLEERPERWKTVSVGDEVNGWEVLHPGRGRGLPRADDNCVVLRRVIEGWRVLHVSDLGAVGQREFLENGGELRADIVIAGMPESGEPLSGDLLEAIRPRAIILGTSRYPYTAVGSPKLRARLEASGAEVFYTNEEDAVTIMFRDEGCEIRAMKGRRVTLRK